MFKQFGKTGVISLLGFAVVSMTIAAVVFSPRPAGSNPFIDEFLNVCARLAFKNVSQGEANRLKSVFEDIDFSIEMHIKNDIAFCALFEGYLTNPMSEDDEQRKKLQPLWLKEPEEVGKAFDEWIEDLDDQLEIQRNTTCLTKKDELDVVTELVYSRALSLPKFGHVIVVEITKRKDSHIEPNRGHFIFLNAITYLFRPKCG